MTIAGLFSVLTFQVKNLQLRFVIGLYKIEHIIRRGNHLYGNPVNQDLSASHRVLTINSWPPLQSG